jgi:hypothetical protein
MSFSKSVIKSSSVVTTKSSSSETDIIGNFNFQELFKYLDTIKEDELKSYDFRGQESLQTIRSSLKGENQQHFVQMFIIYKMRGAKLHKILSDVDLKSKVQLALTKLKVFIPDPSSGNKKPKLGEYRLQSIALAFAHVMYCVSAYIEENFPNRVFKQSELSQIPAGFRWPGSLCIFWAIGVDVNKSVFDNVGVIAKNIQAYEQWMDKFIEVRRRDSGTITDKQKILNKINRTWLGRLMEHYTFESLIEFDKNGKAPAIGVSWDEKSRIALKKTLGYNCFGQYSRPTSWGNLTEINDAVDKVLNNLL